MTDRIFDKLITPYLQQYPNEEIPLCRLFSYGSGDVTKIMQSRG